MFVFSLPLSCSSHQVTSDLGIEDHAKAAHFFLSDGLIVTGRETADAVSLTELDRVREAVSDIPVILGSGVTDKNLASFRGKADAMIVGSHFKQDGHWANDVDRDRVERFMCVHQQLQEWPFCIQKKKFMLL